MKVRRRMAFHFTYQLIIYSVFLLVAVLVFFMFLYNHMSNNEIKRNFPAGALDSIISETYYQNGVVTLPTHWKKFIAEHQVWLQVVDENGKVIFDMNTKAMQPHAYSAAELLTISDSGQYGHFAIETAFDLTYSSPILFMLGYETEQLELLKGWFDRYQKNGLVAEEHLSDLHAQLQEAGSTLTIIDRMGKIIQRVGEASTDPSVQSYAPLEVLAMRQAPGEFDAAITVYQHDGRSPTWIVRAPMDPGALKQQPVIVDIIRLFVAIGAVFLLLSIGITMWHGYRYGQPLIMFTGWFERMEQGQYEEVLTARDRRRVFRKNGKLRLHYRLYREVIQSFYRMAEKLAQTEKDRAELEKTREEWMSGISHDLRTPLSAIQGYGYILESPSSEWNREELREMGRVIREKGDYMLELVTDFSHVYQLKHHSEAVERQELELGELIRRAVLKYVNDATLIGYEFVYEDDKLPIPIVGHATWLHRLMDNLLSNAVNHNRPGITITVTTGMLGGEPYIRVADNGQGMDEETSRKLFDRYYRGTNTEQSSAGSGLGMSIAKMIVEAHHGRIEVRSTLGTGTEISIYFATTSS
ncbi:sensor histidine kinase [Paenibacillus harenae]|uniref:sensor histidine kinase n=1 Tax=Paenibacillus harenae TaxID=306543 RepID=UPI00278CB3B4|nr:HAMP domain-containing sensor histidine kinase [Paenibacillus harenae]MDQ0063126.1 signal transduction histidine kinase [Paenibacillus harenae]